MGSSRSGLPGTNPYDPKLHSHQLIAQLDPSTDEKKAVRRAALMLELNERLKDEGRYSLRPIDAIVATCTDNKRASRLMRLAYRMYEEQEYGAEYTCECGKIFGEQPRFAGHARHCKIHIQAQKEQEE